MSQNKRYMGHCCQCRKFSLWLAWLNDLLLCHDCKWAILNSIPPTPMPLPAPGATP